MLSWDDYSDDEKKVEDKAKKKADPTKSAEDFTLGEKSAEVPSACSLDDPSCDACQ